MLVSYEACVRAVLMILQGYAIATVSERSLIPTRTLYRIWKNFRDYGTVCPEKEKAERPKRLSKEDLE